MAWLYYGMLDCSILNVNIFHWKMLLQFAYKMNGLPLIADVGLPPKSCFNCQKSFS